MYPDFLGIGAQKAGTTWLYHNLRAHPEIWMPPRKEIHYFDQIGEERSNPVSGVLGRRPVDRQWRGQMSGWLRKHALDEPSVDNLLWGFRYLRGTRNDDWYASLFEPGRGKLVGEITPSYSVLSEEAVAHVHGLMPEARIIFVMRNPIERVWSQTVMSFDRSKKGSAGTMKSRKLLRRTKRNTSRLLTNYLRTLRKWSAYYPEEQIFVGFLEDVQLFPAQLLERIYEFLGVNTSFTPQGLEKKVHSRSVGRIPTEVAASLARTHGDEIQSLDERFGGYASFWAYCAEHLIQASPLNDATLVYPFTETLFWDDWVRREGMPSTIQSGTLNSLRSGD